jgi:pyruvate/2-oxoglutarate/acetoin dehydrogenase E1 component
VRLPLVIRIPYAGGIGGVEHHCDSSEAYYAHTPGLTVVAPATNADAYGLLRAAIELPDPVVFLEPKKHYFTREEVDPAAAVAPIGRAVVRRPGRDATLIAYGPSVPVALAAAEQAATEGRDLGVVDLRSIVPFDDDTVCAEVRRTGRAVVVAEAPGFASVAAEIVARVTERCFHHLEAPVRRVTGFDVPYPPPKLEKHYLPGGRPHPRRRRRPAVGRGMSRRVFTLPDLGEGLTGAELVRWLVSAGDAIAVDAPVAEVETAKAVVEVPSPYAARSPNCTARRARRWRWERR